MISLDTILLKFLIFFPFPVTWVGWCQLGSCDWFVAVAAFPTDSVFDVSSFALTQAQPCLLQIFNLLCDKYWRNIIRSESVITWVDFTSTRLCWCCCSNSAAQTRWTQQYGAWSSFSPAALLISGLLAQRGSAKWTTDCRSQLQSNAIVCLRDGENVSQAATAGMWPANQRVGKSKTKL